MSDIRELAKRLPTSLTNNSELKDGATEVTIDDEGIAYIEAELSKHLPRWIPVSERLPEPSYGHNYLVWIKCDNKAAGYRDLAAFGDYICADDDISPDHPLYVADNDEGNRRGSGWHREEETHGGPYDTIFIDLNDKVTHYQHLPAPPEPGR